MTAHKLREAIKISLLIEKAYGHQRNAEIAGGL